MFVLRSPLAVVVFVVSILPSLRSFSPPAASDASATTHYGDPMRLCRLGPLKEGVLGFEALPGGGWDNLRNQDAGLVAAIDYTACKLTEDGRFLIPDDVYIIPIKSSRVESYAELYVHWNNYTSSHSQTINAHAGLSILGVGISGKFSIEYKNVKTRQYMDSSNIVRVQARYIRYKAKLQHGTPLQPAFRNRLLQISAYIELNKMDMATYESQLLVRDFGTHVVTSVDVGAALSQEDEVQASYVRKYTTNHIKASASASFFRVFNFGLGYTPTTTDTMVDEYTRSRTSSFIETYGGLIFQPNNYTANNWTANIDNNLVVMDRSGDPLYYLITPAALPEVPEMTVYQTYESVRAAVELYYKHNMYFGCTARDSPNFSFIANVDDGTCKPQLTNYTFGGVYQTCSNSGPVPVDVCANYRESNPRTGKMSCPDGYDAILINSGAQTVYSNGPSDHKLSVTANYQAYWCVATGVVPQQSGFLFGGLYSSQVANPMTQEMTCPFMFYPVRILTNLTVCIGDDYELGTEYSLPFAGFYSCASGNPLTVSKASSQPGGSMSLGSYMMAAGPTSWPHKCPKGYSQHLATVDHGCEINYCIKSGSLSMPKLPNVNRPPFISAPQQTDHDEKNSVKSGVACYSWKLIQMNDVQDSSYSSGAVVAITVVATLLCVGVVLCAVFACLKRNGGQRHELTGSPSEVASLVSSGDQIFSGQCDDAEIIS